jgi:Spy/CpxP family protein refolding chaperone
MRTAAASLLLLIPLAFVSCQSSGYDEPPPATYPRGGGGGRGGDAMTRPRAESGVLDMLPPSDWWRDPQLANAVNLSADQVAALEKISKEQGDELEKLERDAGVSLRDLRSLLDSDKPAEADIIAAGNRVREMRDAIFDRQLKMLAAERALLTKQQWQTLQDQLATRRTDRGRDRGGYPGRGGFPGRGGRRPGFPG